MRNEHPQDMHVAASIRCAVWLTGYWKARRGGNRSLLAAESFGILVAGRSFSLVRTRGRKEGRECEMRVRRLF